MGESSELQNTEHLSWGSGTLLEISILKHNPNPFLTFSGDTFRSKPTVCDVSGSFKSQNMEQLTH